MQGIHQREHIRTYGGLLAGARRGCIQKAGAAMAAQVRHDHAVALRRQHGGNVDVAVDVVRKTVQQDHGTAVFRAGFMVANIEQVGADLADRQHRRRARGRSCECGCDG